jgi:hypothetical protein
VLGPDAADGFAAAMASGDHACRCGTHVLRALGPPEKSRMADQGTSDGQRLASTRNRARREL